MNDERQRNFFRTADIAKVRANSKLVATGDNGDSLQEK
jgi:hypothetical protein